MKSSTIILAIAVCFIICTQPASAQLWSDYAGKASCVPCHTSIKPIDFAEFEKSGHPWKIQKIDRSKVVGGVYKPFPAGTNVEGVPLAPEATALGFSYTAADTNIAFMIGGFGWKARWMNKDGYIYEGTKAQYNLGTIHPTLKGHGSYNASNVGNAVFALRTPTGLSYTCGACHTTGWKPYDAATQPTRFENRPGFAGNFFEYGVQCEGCHGPAKAHTTNTTIKPTADGFQSCKACHARGSGTRIPVKSDRQFLDHREQYDQMVFTKHRRNANMKCTTCHDPHKSTVYDRGGLKTAGKTCMPCHTGKTINIIVNGTPISHNACDQCHMAYIGMTAVKQNNNRGDQASHMWKIKTAAVNKFQGMWTADSLNVAIPADSIVGITLDFACLGCHTPRDLTWASGHATNIHNKTITVTSVAGEEKVPSAYFISQNYPNPFNPTTSIKFGVPENDQVRISVYNSIGEYVATVADGFYNAGYYTADWSSKDMNGNSVTSGVYIYRIETSKYIDTKKMVLMR
ncbi:MAG: T9SS type A sorting domain-containing protein [Bacteroidetes bacterium]|nr:T9SS type A sorting domain-containing protein [Bacteroidota bacterium]MBU2584449.1 T9SS type A sorting domain-containing protein [Bacteroidota bacterium]